MRVHENVYVQVMHPRRQSVVQSVKKSCTERYAGGGLTEGHEGPALLRDGLVQHALRVLVQRATDLVKERLRGNAHTGGCGYRRGAKSVG